MANRHRGPCPETGVDSRRGATLDRFKNLLHVFNRIEEKMKERGIIDREDLGYGVVGGMAVQIHLRGYQEKHNIKGKPTGKRPSNDIDIYVSESFLEYLPVGLKEERVRATELKLTEEPYRLAIEGMKSGTSAQLIKELNSTEDMELFEKLEVYGIPVNVLKLEHLIPFKISRYNGKKRPLDCYDVMSLAPVVADRQKEKSFSWKEFKKNLKEEYTTRSMESQRLYQEFISEVKKYLRS